MIKKILIHSYLQLVDNWKLAKLTLFTLFSHSLIFVFVIIYNAYFYVENQFHLNTSNEVINYILNLFKFESFGISALLLWIILFFGYFVFAPIGECAIVHYLHHNHKLSKSLSFGFWQFHKIAKYEGMVFMFNFVIFVNLLSKVFIYEMNNGLVLILMFIRLLLVLVVTVFFQYAKTIIILEDVDVFEAIKQSIALSFENFADTLRLVWISMIFNLRLLFNILFIVWIPLVAIILLQMLGLVWVLADAVVYILFFGLVIFLAYINTMIEWYFRIYRYFAYLHVIGNTEQLQKLWVIKNSMSGLFEEHNLQNERDELELLLR